MVKKWWIFVLIIVFVAVIFLTFFYTKKCQNRTCFDSSLRGCKKASYLNDGEEAVWRYRIRGRVWGGEFKKNCKINVELVKIKRGGIEMESVEGKSMDCYLELGVVDFPERDITRCHGILREEMQNIIIQKTHAYILDNIGRISEELEKAL